MTIVLNDPTLWPIINGYRYSSYIVVATFVGVTYDWALSFGQEVELIWGQRWSLMTVLYLGVRYLGILCTAVAMLSIISYIVQLCVGGLIFPILGVVMITRVIFLADNIFNGVAVVMITLYLSGEELILSGTHQCSIDFGKGGLPLDLIIWILGTAWEVLTLCLAIWIAVKHFRELRQYSTGSITRDCFTVLVKAHVVYFVSFVATSCFQLVFDFSVVLSADQNPLKVQNYSGFLQIFLVGQMCVLGPRLILSVRKYHTELVANSDAATGMTSIAFQERVHISTGNSV
ncbi:uncharacterized protein HD556DRAFT_1528071 [Suillus plorans]|uniref:DUF6533 domain-containing protein n=1 Tax=Suillus plorans TaxID=116603 RepID=A0A9P7AM16_9AGAM|nr:uncharacterized protein HD556DRAFT_1528071 [Suillus plorans]KAG1792146.1 hypothetical protein HD556DRAFT_1528071 [Suillus plorans]